MKITRIPIFSIVSFLVLIGVLVVLWHSRKHAEIISFYTPAGHLQGMAADRRGLVFALTDIPFGREMGLTFDTLSPSSDEFKEIHDYIFDPAHEKGHIIGFYLSGATIQPWNWHYNAVFVPYLAPIGVLCLLPLRALRQLLIRRSRIRKGQCLVCGYDLRHSELRCPECGEAIKAKTKPSETTKLANAATA